MHYQFFLKSQCGRFLSGKISTDNFCSTIKELSNKFNEPGLDGGNIFDMLNFIALERIINNYLSHLDEENLKKEIESHLKDEMFWK